MNSVVIASKLDTDLEAKICRLGFYGNILHSYTAQQIFNKTTEEYLERKLKMEIQKG
ncbi:unnamed protein product [Paramecium sonneborni]|uniref:Selenocysteine-specific elongation factor 3rd domain-containing protein n=1 Tax=Paramecium sonneborni TaxID=65129 RepID=A0A8S1RQM5_9CILI|nr:unnamed protein product [Paramecium sonneborni]